jgi:hypothetical protein
MNCREYKNSLGFLYESFQKQRKITSENIPLVFYFLRIVNRIYPVESGLAGLACPCGHITLIIHLF